MARKKKNLFFFFVLNGATGERGGPAVGNSFSKPAARWATVECFQLDCDYAAKQTCPYIFSVCVCCCYCCFLLSHIVVCLFPFFLQVPFSVSDQLMITTPPSSLAYYLRFCFS